MAIHRRGFLQSACVVFVFLSLCHFGYVFCAKIRNHNDEIDNDINNGHVGTSIRNSKLRNTISNNNDRKFQPQQQDQVQQNQNQGASFRKNPRSRHQPNDHQFEKKSLGQQDQQGNIHRDPMRGDQQPINNQQNNVKQQQPGDKRPKQLRIAETDECRDSVKRLCHNTLLNNNFAVLECLHNRKVHGILSCHTFFLSYDGSITSNRTSPIYIRC